MYRTLLCINSLSDPERCLFHSSLSYCYFEFGSYYLYKNICPDSSVCLCICSDQIEDCCCCLFGAEDWRLSLSYLISVCSFHLDYLDFYVVYFLLFETLLYLWVASWTTLMTMLYFRCTILWCYISVILWWFSFIYLYSINDSCFVLFKLTCVDYCQFKWSKYTGCYSWYQSFGSR